MVWSPLSWNLDSRTRQQGVDTFLSNARYWRNDIASERAIAGEQAAQSKWRNPNAFEELSGLLNDAERFLEKENIAKQAHRQMWEGRLEIAQNWGGKKVKHVPGQMRKFIRSLRDCQSEAAQLRQLVDETRREFQL